VRDVSGFLGSPSRGPTRVPTARIFVRGSVRAISDSNFTWIPMAWWNAPPSFCRCDLTHQYTVGTQMSIWKTNSSWNDYLDRARNALRERPCSEAITSQEILQPSYKVHMCGGCRQLICGLPEFSRHVGEEVDRVVSKVRELLHLSFLDILVNLVPFRSLWIYLLTRRSTGLRDGFSTTHY
jgi:hypothetical protein